MSNQGSEIIESRKIRIGNEEYIEAFCIRLQSKNLILLRGPKGYVMCGYLDMEVADKFKDVAVKIVGVASIEDALETQVHSSSLAAKELGINPGQPIAEVLKIIA